MLRVIINLIITECYNIMYKHKIAKPPKVITREQFLQDIFALGRLYEYGYDTIVGAVELADRFMTITEPRQSYHEHIQMETLDDASKLLATTPIDHCYSDELVVVALTLAGKCNEDDPHSIMYGLLNCENYYIVKMEWEIAQCFQYHIRVNNFMTYLGLIFDDTPILGPEFGALAQDVCRVLSWYTMSPVTILMASLWLHQQGKLKAIATAKHQRFVTFIETVAAECEATKIDTLNAYITMHNK